jgi:adenylate kinase family enzyme
MNKLVVLIVGPAGAGKSTLAENLSRKLHPSVNLKVDEFKDFIVNKFIYGPSEEGAKQWAILGDNIGMVAKNFHQAGYNVIISGFMRDPALENMMKHLSFSHKILLLPDLNEAESRDATRPKGRQLGPEGIKEHYEYYQSSDKYKDFTKVDSTSLAAEETAEEVLKILEESAAQSDD